MIDRRIADIHNNKQAKAGYKYYGSDGKVYIGLKTGRLKLYEPVTSTTVQNITNTTVESTGVQSVTGLNTDNTDPANPVIQISVDGITITGDGTPANPLIASSTSTGVQTVTDDGNGVVSVDNTDPINPVIQFNGVNVDGVTITGDGTSGNPLVASPGSGYVPYVGATNNVDLGVYGLTTDYVAFSQTPTVGPGHAQIGYNGATLALAYDFDNTNVRVNIGQQMYAYVKNDEAVTITKGQAVYLYQASGNKATVKLAYNTSDATSAKTLGLAAEDILSGRDGLVITQGVLDGINTLAYPAGTSLYLGATAGSWTGTKPYAPNHLVYIGVVERSNAGNGQIFVRVQNGYELDEIHDVDLITSPPTNGQVLTYNSATQLWVNQTPTTGTITSIATSSPITGGTITTSGTIGIQDAKADGTTKGASTYFATDFEDNGAGLIKIDYINGQAASSLTKGFLTSADWSTFNSKQPAGSYITGLTGDVTASGPGSVAATIANGAVTYAKMQAASTTSKLIGSSASSTTLQEITLGTGLSMSGSTLNSSASGPTINQVMAYIAAY